MIRSPERFVHVTTALRVSFEFNISRPPVLDDMEVTAADDNNEFFLDVRVDYNNDSRQFPSDVRWSLKNDNWPIITPGHWFEASTEFCVKGGKKFTVNFVSHHNNKCSRSYVSTISLRTILIELGKQIFPRCSFVSCKTDLVPFVLFSRRSIEMRPVSGTGAFYTALHDTSLQKPSNAK